MKLCEKDYCTGCLACYNACDSNAIELYNDQEGFLFPNINSSLCIECGKCTTVCPIINNQNIQYKYPLKGLAAWSGNRRIRRKSSSGGVFTEIARSVVEEGGVVFGAGYRGKNVIHLSIENIKDLHVLRGSKYVQSYIGDSYIKVERFLQDERKVLFSGTPCQIAGLKSFLGMQYKNLLTIDLICHGVPSPKIFYDYLCWLEVKNKSMVSHFEFRDKKWSWQRYNIKAIFKNGQKYYGKWHSDPYIRGFLRDYYLRKSCHHCNFSRNQRVSDITLGDFWGYKNDSIHKDNDKGISAVLLNTDKGLEYSGFCSRDGNICICKPIEDIVKGNAALQGSFEPSLLRTEFWNDYYKNGFEDIISKYMYSDEIPDKFIRLYKFGRNNLVNILFKYGNIIIRKVKKIFVR